MDSGGGESAGGRYRVAGTAGQPEAGTLSGGHYTLAGGFWVGNITPTRHGVFLPVLVRD